MNNAVAVVLGGGQGTRLRPLTTYRSKPAVPLAGKYRLIDIPLSNCINSQLRRIYVLTQFMSVSLHRHIRGTYRFDNFSRGYVEILAAQQTLMEGTDWYQGTADAVRKNLRYLTQPGIDYVVILSGDQLYRMDFQKMIQTHCSAQADITIAAKPVHAAEASSLGVMRADSTGRITGFVEKPQTEEQLNQVRIDPSWIDSRGIVSNGRNCLASMGIYIFNRQVLVDALQDTSRKDFGKQIFPQSIDDRKVQLHLFDGYWEDIGTIGSFYEANLQLTRTDPPFEMASAKSPIYSHPRFLPPSRMDGATIQHSLIADGCVIEEGAHIENSVIGLRCRIGRDVTIRNSVIMGADYYEESITNKGGKIHEKDGGQNDSGNSSRSNSVSMGIGSDTVIEGAIIDKNCRIGSRAEIINRNKIQDSTEGAFFEIHDGIVVVKKDATVPSEWRG
ncbi:MAG: glucose-1-phosphate adenylyltransferase [Pirellulales bacterium]